MKSPRAEAKEIPRRATGGSGIFEHVSTVADLLARPFVFPEEMGTLGGIYDSQVPGDFKLGLPLQDLSTLLTLGNITPQERLALSGLFTQALLERNRAKYIFLVHWVLLSGSIGGRRARDLIQLTTGATKSIRESVNLSRFRRIFTGSKGQVETVADEEGYDLPTTG